MEIENIRKYKKDFEPMGLDLQGWQGDNPIFTFLVEKIKPKVIVEIGSWKGQSTYSMAKACKTLMLDTEIQCIDTWLGAEEFYTKPTEDRNLLKKAGYPQVYYQFISNMIHKNVDDIIYPIPVPSSIGVKICKKADLVYIDGSHEYEDVIKDMQGMWAKLNEGGTMFGDDYKNGAFPGVKKAVDEFAEKNNLVVQVIDNWFWLIQK